MQCEIGLLATISFWCCVLATSIECQLSVSIQDTWFVQLSIYIVYTDHRLVHSRVNLKKCNVILTGNWKLNSQLFGEKDFQDQLLLRLLGEFKAPVIFNKQQDIPKEVINVSTRHTTLQDKRILTTNADVCEAFLE